MEQIDTLKKAYIEEWKSQLEKEKQYAKGNIKYFAELEKISDLEIVDIMKIMPKVPQLKKNSIAYKGYLYPYRLSKINGVPIHYDAEKVDTFLLGTINCCIASTNFIGRSINVDKHTLESDTKYLLLYFTDPKSNPGNKEENIWLFRSKEKMSLIEGTEKSYKYFYEDNNYITYEQLALEMRRVLEMDKIISKLGKEISEILEEDTSATDKKKKRQFIVNGAPGTGKTYTAQRVAVEKCLSEDGLAECKRVWEDKHFFEEKYKKYKENKRIQFVQFHSSYDYTDFVEGLRPVNLGESETPTFVRMDGTFKKFCRNAVRDSKKHYFFIIDEVNRADLSKVFGELLFGLEEGYRGEEYSFETQYMTLPTYYLKDGKIEKYKEADDAFAKGFYIPENVIVIGTMNDIDRSVETFDFALRRRFEWIRACANDEMEGLSAFSAEVIQRIKAMNDYISGEEGRKFGLNEDYQVGPAYFYGTESKPISEIWENSIKPLLREYLRGQNEKTVNKFICECGQKLLGQ